MLDQTTGPGYASPAEAVKAPKEKIVYTVSVSYTHLTLPTKRIV